MDDSTLTRLSTAHHARFAPSVDRDRLGPVGLWTFDFDQLPFGDIRPTVERLEELGTRCLWIPELFGRDALIQTALLLGATRSLVVGNGIARIDFRQPRAMAASALALADAYPGRHVLGLGVGPFPAGDPFELMGRYLEELDRAEVSFPLPERPPPLVLAAHGPKMAEFAAARTAGVHTYLVTVDHTADVRKRIGRDAFLAAEQAVVVNPDPAAVRAAARSHVGWYLQTPYNIAKFRRLGFDDNDLADGGSDRLVDALVAGGSPERAAERIREQLSAGADHVGVQILGTDGRGELTEAWASVLAALG